MQIADELFECVWPFCGIGASKDNDIWVSNIRCFNDVAIKIPYHCSFITDGAMLLFMISKSGSAFTFDIEKYELNIHTDFAGTAEMISQDLRILIPRK